MTYKEFDKLFESRVEKLKETGKTKGVKYTKGSEDRLVSFKDCVSGITPLQVWEIFFRKHWSSIEYFLKTGQNIGEDICDTHIHDCIMYLFLLEGLIKDTKTMEITGFSTVNNPLTIQDMTKRKLMKLSHILADVDGKTVLTHFIHLKYEMINILEIISIKFNEETIGIITTNNVQHLISDKEDIKQIKEFFNV